MTAEHRYTYPAGHQPITTGDPRDRRLASYGLTPAQDVEVEVLVTAASGYPRTLEGTVIDALDNVLVLETKAGRRTTRVPWSAIALIRDALTHPGN